MKKYNRTNHRQTTEQMDDSNYAQEYRRFREQHIDQDLNSVPGLGLAAIVKLNANNLTKTDHLIGNFFLVERDEVKFIEFLEEIGINPQFARICAKAFAQKFGSL